MATAVSKLYPPYVEGMLPAFTDITKVTIPFTANKSVSSQEVAGMSLIIKTVQNSTVLRKTGTSQGAVTTNDPNCGYDINNGVAWFDLSDFPLNVGQYYKVQLAYIAGNNTAGFYSQCSTIKYTRKPVFGIEGLTIGATNAHMYKYVGTYRQVKDPMNNQSFIDQTEKMYSCRFVLQDASGEVLNDSGNILHNSSTDTSATESYETYEVPIDLNPGNIYTLTFSITTTNQYTDSVKYKIMANPAFTIAERYTLLPKNIFDDGIIEISATCSAPFNGKYVLTRAGSDDDYTWRQIATVSLTGGTAKNGIYELKSFWKDFTAKQGVYYKYGLQLVNHFGAYSNKIESEEVYSDYEHSFLYDGMRQLKIKLNPKVSSYKIDILEAKLETIGSKYPFFFRNGNVYYHEFPISGLISYQMDDNQLFLTDNKMGLTPTKELYRKSSPSPEEDAFWGNVRTTSLQNYNFFAERIFKNEVLEWLNNGQIKLFRSPTEGNFIVRLMNVSLSPQDSINRLLHSFSATAYEIADYSFDSLRNYSFISSEDLDTDTEENTFIYTNKFLYLYREDSELTKKINEWCNNTSATNAVPCYFTNLEARRIENAVPDFNNKFEFERQNQYYIIKDKTTRTFITPQKMISDIKEYISSKRTYLTDEITLGIVPRLTIGDLAPGQKVTLTTQSGRILPIIIGTTGSYVYDVEDDPIISLILPPYSDELINLIDAHLEYTSKESIITNTDIYQTIALYDVPARQWIGGMYDGNIIGKNANDEDQTGHYNSQWEIQNIKDELINILYLRAFKKGIRQLITNGSTYYYLDDFIANGGKFDNINPFNIQKDNNALAVYEIYELPQELINIVQTNYAAVENYLRHGYIPAINNGELTWDELKPKEYAISDRMGGLRLNKITNPEDMYKITIQVSKDSDAETIDLDLTTSFETSQLNNIYNITIGAGIVLEMGYQIKQTVYSVETNDTLTNGRKADYEESWSNIQSSLTIGKTVTDTEWAQMYIKQNAFLDQIYTAIHQ